MNSDPPPKGPVSLLEQARATASASPGGSATADDGLGDGAVEIDTDPSQGTYQVSQGKRLVQPDGSGGSLTLSGGPRAKADASGAQGSAYVTTGLAFAVATDTRGLTISRAGAHNETTDSDGTVHGDTIYSAINVCQ